MSGDFCGRCGKRIAGLIQDATVCKCNSERRSHNEVRITCPHCKLAIRVEVRG